MFVSWFTSMQPNIRFGGLHIMNRITIEEFAKVEIKIGTVKSAEKVPDADKLIKLIFDFGPKENVIPAEAGIQEDGSQVKPGMTTDGSGMTTEEIATDSSSPRNDVQRDVRQIMSAIAPFYPDPSVLVGKQIAVCVNLEPKTFRGYESQGMIMATDTEDGQISLLVPEKPVKEGAKIH